MPQYVSGLYSIHGNISSFPHTSSWSRRQCSFYKGWNTSAAYQFDLCVPVHSLTKLDFHYSYSDVYSEVYVLQL